MRERHTELRGPSSLDAQLQRAPEAAASQMPQATHLNRAGGGTTSSTETEPMTKKTETPGAMCHETPDSGSHRAGGGLMRFETQHSTAPATNIDGQPTSETPVSVAVDPAASQIVIDARAEHAGGGTDQSELRGQFDSEAQRVVAPDQQGGGQPRADTHTVPAPSLPDLRFDDPAVAEIVQMHRQRRRWLKARNALILQAKALCRAHVGGDKKDGTGAFDAAAKGTGDDPILIVALAPFLSSIETFDAELKQIERYLEKAAKRLPIWTWAEPIRGLGAASVAAIVGEAGDLSKYRTVSGVWKRLGLAVIDGDGRQRRRADADLAMLHGYSPERRSIVWNVGEAMSKHQREWRDKETGEVTKPAGPYGDVLVAEKEKALARGWTPAHAENHAKRLMTKRMLRDMVVAWRQIAGQDRPETHSSGARDLPTLMAAE